MHQNFQSIKLKVPGRPLTLVNTALYCDCMMAQCSCYSLPIGFLFQWCMQFPIPWIIAMERRPSYMHAHCDTTMMLTPCCYVYMESTCYRNQKLTPVASCAYLFPFFLKSELGKACLLCKCNEIVSIMLLIACSSHAAVLLCQCRISWTSKHTAHPSNTYSLDSVDCKWLNLASNSLAGCTSFSHWLCSKLAEK